MGNIIPRKTYQTIEYRLHTYEQTKARIHDWEASVCGQNREPELIPNHGYHSDPTARVVMKLMNPPKDIREDIMWAELIEKVMEYCRENGKSALFDVWYGKPRQSVISAAMKVPTHQNTLKNWRTDTVYYIALRANKCGLITVD